MYVLWDLRVLEGVYITVMGVLYNQTPRFVNLFEIATMDSVINAGKVLIRLSNIPAIVPQFL